MKNSIRPARRSFTLFIGFVACLITQCCLAQGSTKWEKEIKVFEQADQSNPPAKGSILFIGSSSIRFWKDLDQAFPGKTIINRGFGGSEIADITQLADRILFPYQPKQIVIYSGDNDIANGKSPETVASDFSVLFEQIRSKLPQTPIIFLSIKPSPSRIKYLEKVKEANTLIAKYLKKQRKAIYVDVFSPMLDKEGKPIPTLYKEDQLHMTQEGYDLWAKVLRPYLKK